MLQEKIEELIDLINAIGENIAKEEVEKTDVLMQNLPPLLNYVFPNIVQSYLCDELAESRGDMEYWVQQLERIIYAMQGKDRFALFDILYCETKENLLFYLDMVKKAGIVL